MQAALQGAADAGEEELPAELVDELHFGGFVRKATPGQLPEQDQPERRTKKEVCTLLHISCHVAGPKSFCRQPHMHSPRELGSVCNAEPAGFDLHVLQQSAV